MSIVLIIETPGDKFGGVVVLLPKGKCGVLENGFKGDKTIFSCDLHLVCLQKLIISHSFTDSQQKVYPAIQFIDFPDDSIGRKVQVLVVSYGNYGVYSEFDAIEYKAFRTKNELIPLVEIGLAKRVVLVYSWSRFEHDFIAEGIFK